MVYFMWFVLCGLLAWWANSWGRSSGGFFLLSLLLSPLVAAIVLLVKGRNRQLLEQVAVSSGQLARCPFCRETIRPGATVCPHCQREQPDPMAGRLNINQIGGKTLFKNID